MPLKPEENPIKDGISITKKGACLGAEISGLNLTQKISNQKIKIIQNALVKHEVLVFRNQKISLDQFINFGAQFGELLIHPFRNVGAGVNKLSRTTKAGQRELIILDNDGKNPPHSTDQWHSDEMFRKTPPAATILRSKIVPKFGGDTVFASMTTAYKSLSPSLQKFCAKLEAVHDFKVFRSLYSKDHEGRKKLLEIEKNFPNTTHPVITTHPISKKKVVFVSPQTTTKIRALRDFESESILDLLYRLPEMPEYQFRVKWEPNMFIIWDNRSTQHYAPRDFLPERRKMERLTIKGDRPY